MLKFDSASIARWESSGISEVAVVFVDGGCAGTKVSVIESPSPETVAGYAKMSLGSISVRFEESYRDKLDGARLTRVDKSGKSVWIFSTPAVKGRCGCGTSFSFDSEYSGGSHAETKKPVPDLSKIAALKAAFASAR